MTLRLFEPDDATESPQQAHVPITGRLLFCAWASLVAVIPAITASYSALQVTRFFRSLKNAENATTARVLDSFHVINIPLIIALGVSALLAFGIALVLATNRKHILSSVGLPLSIGVPILAAAPGAFIWFAETTTIDVMSGKVTGVQIAALAETVSLLLFFALASGLLVQAATFLCAVVSLCIPAQSRTDALSLRRAFAWAVSGTLLLVFAGAFFLV